MVRYSFPAGLFHSLLHAGLSRRSDGLNRHRPKSAVGDRAYVPDENFGLAGALLLRCLEIPGASSPDSPPVTQRWTRDIWNATGFCGGDVAADV